ncbi:PTI1-like tyrosine-protein kinase At3g15890 [Cryptomeria japonica]|uniref:PTI1-like tyrosine-protein kinase At3g15890 n=1 Tax=Cryptomeria japonica TaxID=3369 RepID=UPI0027D9E3D5|nr:PTI1-like tyrosine-protein kinase At3g15890 [Cryptomeria japonica]
MAEVADGGACSPQRWWHRRYGSPPTVEAKAFNCGLRPTVAVAAATGEPAPTMKKGRPAGRYSGSVKPWRIFTLKELQIATANFSEENKLGEGGFGSVYWGRTHDGLEIAVKKLKSMNSKAEMEFAVEVEILGRVRHKNLLGLRGYCAGGDERLIVYDYMPNLSLLSHLHGQLAADVELNWQRRMNIALGSAEGLVYLHHEATPHIIHRDIKASNVLLDSNYDAQVADFGFAKLIPDGVSHLTTRVKGTLGYLAPEYAMWGKVSESCDVYSFGILLLEIISGRKPIEKLPGGVKRTIIEWASPLVHKERYSELVDPRLQGKFEETQLKRAIYVATRCAQNSPEDRPNMREVADMLRGERRSRDVNFVKLESARYDDDLLQQDQSSDDDDESYVSEIKQQKKINNAQKVQRSQQQPNHYGTRGKALR